MFDFTRIECDGDAVVHCSTKDVAEEFLKYLKERYPKKSFFGDATHWNFYGENTCYWPNFKSGEGLQYGHLEYAIETGYNIYEIDELMIAELPIEASDIDIKCLFGME